MKASDYIAEFLKTQEITTSFVMAGGMITHILDSLYYSGSPRIVAVHHEQAAAFAADAYGRITGKPGIGLATSGPGATNLLTGIASCYFDSSPAVFITGQVNTNELKGIRPIRQLGFQETDIVAMAAPITKACFQVERANQIEEIMYRAFEIAMSGRPGPVLIDIPMNLQRADITVAPIQKVHRHTQVAANFRTSSLKALQESITNAKRPLVLAGRGIRSAFAVDRLRSFIEHTQLPVVTSLLAVDVMPYHHPLRVGFIGSYGNRWANLALGTADVIIVIGSRLDIRQTGADVEGFRKGKKIFHIDCDEGEINNRVVECVSIVVDAGEFLDHATREFASAQFAKRKEWLEEIQGLRERWPDIQEIHGIPGINPNSFMHALSQQSMGASGYCVDVGNHQMWAAQSLELQPNQFFMTSGGMGSMGFALPAAIGASFADDMKPVVVIAGDGGFQLNIQELQTVVRTKLPLKMVVINNNTLGMIRQFQDSYFEGRHQSTSWGYSAPDFAEVAKAFGIEALTISTTEEIEKALRWMWRTPDSPSLLQVMIDMQANAYPKIAFGKPITEMEPFAKPLDMEGT